MDGALNLAEIGLERGTNPSPIGGIVIDRNIDAGQFIRRLGSVAE
ncbi:hypothetical protein [Hongsoonwoonella zoysiae]|nr:hypothetical protein [Hongsoonwoonella zoysiae]